MRRKRTTKIDVEQIERQKKIADIEERLDTIHNEMQTRIYNASDFEALCRERNRLLIEKQQLEHPVHLQRESIKTYSIIH